MANVQSISDYDDAAPAGCSIYIRYVTLILLKYSERMSYLSQLPGDVFDEGQWCSAAEFEYYIKRFHSLFYVPKDTHLYVVAGNHDMGFHYGMIKDILHI